jgi:hypothetical protein
MSNSNRHDPGNLPIVLLGGGAGVKTGRHLKYDENTPMANLLVTLLDRLGVPLDRIGNSNGKVDLAGLSL